MKYISASILAFSLAIVAVQTGASVAEDHR